MLKAYKYRLYPSDDQKVMLAKHFGSCRFVWNYFLDIRNKRYSETGKGMTYNEMSSTLTKLKHDGDYAWLGEVNSQSLQQTLMHLNTAFDRFLRHLGKYPNFKKKSNKQSFVVPQRYEVVGNKLHIPNFKEPIRMFKHRDSKGEVRSITVSQNPSGKYYASILVLEEDQVVEETYIRPETTVGIDMGLKHFLTTSEGLQVMNPKHLIESGKRLKKAQKRLSRKKKGSNNRKRQRIKVARIHEHVANQRKDFLNKVSDVLMRTYGTIAVENLNVDGMVRNHYLAKSIEDAGWSSFIAMLKAKALQRGKNVIEIGRFEPSSKMCSRCGSIRNDLKLSDRTYRCNDCGLSINRDINAAINIKKFGMISADVPTDSGKFTPVDRGADTLFQLEREGIGQVRWLRQEVHIL